jgi:hypothetical protein
MRSIHCCVSKSDRGGPDTIASASFARLQQSPVGRMPQPEGQPSAVNGIPHAKPRNPARSGRGGSRSRSKRCGFPQRTPPVMTSDPRLFVQYGRILLVSHACGSVEPLRPCPANTSPTCRTPSLPGRTTSNRLCAHHAGVGGRSSSSRALTYLHQIGPTDQFREGGALAAVPLAVQLAVDVNPGPAVVIGDGGMISGSLQMLPC